MDLPDLKRLIAGFLVLSAITSAITLISFNFFGTNTRGQQGIQAEGESPLSTVGKNAFVEKLPSSENTAGNTAAKADAGAESSSLSSNLTQNLASVFAEEMIANNSEGPQYDLDGNPSVINLPAEDKAAEMIKQALSKTNIQVGKEISASEIKIKNSYEQQDIAAYLEAAGKILNGTALGVRSLDIANADSIPENLNASQLIFESAYQKLKAVPVPLPLVGMHRAFLVFLSNQNEVFKIASDYQNDPMKTVLVLKAESKIIERDFKKLKDEVNATKSLGLLLDDEYSQQKNVLLFSLEGALGIRTANAALPVIDFSLIGTTIANWAKDFASKAIEWAYTTALRIAVNVLINEFQNQVVNWIAGNGNPKFITDWNGFLRDVANKAAGNAIYSLVPQLCTGLGPLIRVALLPVPYANTGVRCTLNQVVNNVQNFVNRFQSGGWYAYSYAMQPNNNFYGALIVTYDRQLTEIMAAKEAANSQAVASKGFLSVTKCVESTTIEDEDGNTSEVCLKEVDTTPGAIVGEALTSSLGWKPNQIVSAQRFEDLVAAIVNASINRIIREGLSSLTEAVNPGTPSFTGATPTGVVNPSGSNTSSLRASVNSLMDSLEQTGTLQQNQLIIDADAQWLNLEPQVIISLNELNASCTNLSGDISQTISALNSLYLTVQNELDDALFLQNARSTAAAATSTEALLAISDEIQNVDIEQIANDAAAAQDRLDALNALGTTVQRNLSDGTCNTLPSATSTQAISQ
ncbi:MAG: hypothetical protein HY432_03890 [Candidatus Liptonbacteria bacterium]|nr:hypothetical protein [Candidatus Liptonbacteria bacterium]